MNHSFNVEVAKKYGIEKAILLENFYFWIAKNKANKKNIYDGKSYTYNTAEAFEELFPYMKARKISQLLREMEQENLLLSRQFGKYDRTKSYTLTDYALSLFVQSNIPKLDNERYQNLTMKDTKIGCCLNTDINTDIDTDINTDKEPAKANNSKTSKEKTSANKPDTVSQEVWDEYVSLRKQKRTTVTPLVIKGIEREAEKAGISLEVALTTCIERGWQGFKADWIKPSIFDGKHGKPAFRIASDNVTLKDGEINF
jgi:adenylate kinase family enzyme